MDRFKFWKEHKTKQALLVTGARQVGKTFLIREFVQANYESFVEFNLVEDEVSRASFCKATSAHDLMLRISAASPIVLKPSNTAIFIDEVQESPEIVTFIKFLVDKGGYDFILSGSMLGVTLENISSQPVGYVTEVVMYPLDFEEFCWASGMGDDIFAIAQACFLQKSPLPDYLHIRLTDLFHRYLLVGGMPDAVAAFLEFGTVDQVRIAQDDIMAFYVRDITQYAPKDRKLIIRSIFDLIPSELSNQNKRFRLSSIANIKKYTQVEQEFLWLTKANVALAAYNVRAPINPLLLSENHSLFKLFLSDVGLLTSRFPKGLSLGLIDGRPPKNMGGIYENFVAQELTAHGFTLRYYASRKIGELDFVLERKAGSIIALEVKSGAGYKTHAALTNALGIKGYDISEAMVFAETNIEIKDDVTYYPVYLISALMNE